MTKIPPKPLFSYFQRLRVYFFILQDQWHVGHFRYFEGHFGRFRGVRVFLVILEVLGCLWPFLRFWVYLGHFKSLGVLSSLYRFEGILVILGFKGILVIFQVQGVFWSFYRLQGYFGNFQVFGIFQSYYWFQGYFGHFLCFGGILIIFRF